MSSTSQKSGVVVWEWEERQGLWIPYQADVVEYLEKKYLRLKQRVSKKSTVSLGKHFFGLLSYEVDLVNMEQQRTETGESSRGILVLLKFRQFPERRLTNPRAAHLGNRK